MGEDPENLVLVFLRRLDGKMDGIPVPRIDVVSPFFARMAGLQGPATQSDSENMRF
jgi:hypothetical protein